MDYRVFSFFRLSQRRIPALIAIMAILMLFIAPDVSTILEQRRNTEHHQMPAEHHRGESSGTMAQHGVMDKMPQATDNAHCHTAPSPSAASDDGQPHHRSSGKMLEHFACGYCQLLVQLPLLLIMFIAIIRLLLLAISTPPPLRFSPYHFTFFPGLSQPRAPPVG